jgi:hypothetical protein
LHGQLAEAKDTIDIKINDTPRFEPAATDGSRTIGKQVDDFARAVSAVLS